MEAILLLLYMRRVLDTYKRERLCKCVETPEDRKAIKIDVIIREEAIKISLVDATYF